jgi:hypothetical protein
MITSIGLLSFTDKGIQVSGTLRTGNGEPLKFKFAAKGDLESGSALKFTAHAHGDGVDAHVSGRVKFA